MYKNYGDIYDCVDVLMLGAPVAEKIYDNLKPRISALIDKGYYPSVKLAPNHQSSDDMTYARMIIKKAEALGINVTSYPEGTITEPVIGRAVVEMLKFYEIPISGQFACVIGRSKTVGRPIAEALLNEDATVVQCHSKSGYDNLENALRHADIIVSATGVYNLINNSNVAQVISDHSTIIDVGCNFVDGKMVGDFDPSVIDYMYAVTPVPGGIGPVTIAMEMVHAVEECEKELEDNQQ